MRIATCNVSGVKADCPCFCAGWPEHDRTSSAYKSFRCADTAIDWAETALRAASLHPWRRVYRQQSTPRGIGVRNSDPHPMQNTASSGYRYTITSRRHARTSAVGALGRRKRSDLIVRPETLPGSAETRARCCRCSRKMLSAAASVRHGALHHPGKPLSSTGKRIFIIVHTHWSGRFRPRRR